MSATMEASTFSRYFSNLGSSASHGSGKGGTAASKPSTGCVVIEIPGRTFPVKELYLDDIVGVTDVPFMLPKKAELFPEAAAAGDDADKSLSRSFKLCYASVAFPRNGALSNPIWPRLLVAGWKW